MIYPQVSQTWSNQFFSAHVEEGFRVWAAQVNILGVPLNTVRLCDLVRINKWSVGRVYPQVTYPTRWVTKVYNDENEPDFFALYTQDHKLYMVVMDEYMAYAEGRKENLTIVPGWVPVPMPQEWNDQEKDALKAWQEKNLW